MNNKKIIVDLRSLHTSEFSGVESYTVHVLEHLIETDRETVYKLFYNGFFKKQFDYFHFINAEYIQTRIPNRIMNIAIKLFNYPKLENLIKTDGTVFMPNWNTLSVQSTTKVVLTVHDLSPQFMPEYYNLKSRIWHWFINIPKLVKRADKIIAVSEFTKLSLIEKLQVPAEKITVAQLGIDHENYKALLSVNRLREIRNSYDLPGDYVLYLGTVEPRKNIVRLIEAFEQMQAPISLVIAGKLGWKYNSVIKRIKQSSKRRFIHLLGYVPEADKPYIMKLARVFAWPSLYEGFGLPVLEAMAVGTPVVTSNVSSLPEVVGDSAILVNPYNTEDIARAIELLQTDEQTRENYITKGLQRSKQFSWERCAETIKKVLH